MSAGGAEEGSAGRTTVLGLAEQCDAVLALHRRRDTVAEELGFGAQLADDAHMVRGGDVEEGGDGRVVRDCGALVGVREGDGRWQTLLRNVEALRAVRVVVSAPEELS